MPIPVFRVEKNGNYTTMSNYHLQDKALSLKAKGLLSMLLSLPDSWSYSVRGLAAISREGKDGIRSGLQELERYGYLIRKQKRCASGKMGLIEYVIPFSRQRLMVNFKLFPVTEQRQNPAAVSFLLLHLMRQSCLR